MYELQTQRMASQRTFGTFAASFLRFGSEGRYMKDPEAAGPLRIWRKDIRQGNPRNFRCDDKALDISGWHSKRNHNKRNYAGAASNRV